MSDKNKTKAQLIEEMAALRERNTELEAREAEAKIQAERMTLLNKMSQELSRAVNEVEVFKTTARYTYQIFTQAERASVTLLDATGDSFDVFALEEGQTDVTRHGEQIPIKGRAIGLIVRENRLLSTPDIRTSNLLDFRSLAESGIRSVIGAPLVTGGRVIGTLNVASKNLDAFNRRDEEMILQITALLASIIENRHLFDETTRLLAESEAQVTELSTLNIISEGLVGQLDLQGMIDLVGDKIREIVDEGNVAIALYDAERDIVETPYWFDHDLRVHFEPTPLGQGLVSIVITSGQPLNLDTFQEMLDHGVIVPPHRKKDITPDLEASWLGVPILIGNNVKGAIYINKFQNNAFSEADVRLLTTVAANMGVAIENARLFERIQQTNQELSQTLEKLRTTQGQLVEAEKMAALGGLVAGVAHEINTPVGVGVTAASTLQDRTSGFSEIYKSGQMKRSDLDKYLNIAEQSSAMILRNLERAAELIQSFKQVAVDQSSEERRSFLVKAYLEEILLSLRPKLKKTQLTIEVNGDDSLTLDSYPGAFSQIVTNLVMNSLLHAYGPDDQGKLTFDLGQRDGHLIFEYNDDGKGIPQENLSKIFEPFFTTKRTQGGSGLGLHIIYNLVTQRLGGAIHCESEVGSGTKFVIEVPIS